MVDQYDIHEVPKVPKQFNQLGIFVLDGSGSMNDPTRDKISKAEAVDMSMREVIGKLKNSRQLKNFSIAVVTFGTSAKQHTPVTPVEQADDYADYNPLKDHGGGTDIGVGLRCAQGIAQEFLSQADTVRRSVVIIVMSDGLSGGEPLLAANAIKAIPEITICTTLFAAADAVNDTDQGLLQDIASSPLNYRTTYRAEDLRKFFIASVSSGKNVDIS